MTALPQCPKCQSTLRPQARFCEECGTALSATTIDTAPALPKKRDWRPWLAVGAALVLSAAVYMPGWLQTDYREARSRAQAESSTAVTLYVADNVLRRQVSGSGPERTMLRRGAEVTGTVIRQGGKAWLVTSDNGDYISAGRLMDTAPPALAQQYADYRWNITAPVDVYAGDSRFSDVVKQLQPGTTIMIIGLTTSGFLEFKLSPEKEIEGYISADALGFDATSAEGQSIGAQAREQIAVLGLATDTPLTLNGTTGSTKTTLTIQLGDDGETLTGQSSYASKLGGTLYECSFLLRFTGLDAQQRLRFDQAPLMPGQNLSDMCRIWPSIAIAIPDGQDTAYGVEWTVNDKILRTTRLTRAAAN